MAEQRLCASCGQALASPRIPTPIVAVGRFRYHAWCWVANEAPSLKAGAMVN